MFENLSLLVPTKSMLFNFLYKVNEFAVFVEF